MEVGVRRRKGGYTIESGDNVAFVSGGRVSLR